MGPVTRSSQNRRPQVPSSPPEQNEQEPIPDDPTSYSDEHDDGDDENSENENDPFNVEDDEDEPPSFAVHSSTAHDLLHPLQETAERVSRQVEEFAKCLDKFNTSRETSDQKLWDDAVGIVERYEAIAHTRRERTASKSNRSRSSSGNRCSLGDTEGELQKLGLEANLWSLAQHILICNSPDSSLQASGFAESALNALHRYSAPPDIWNAFLNSDIAGQEYEGILNWLQETAASSSINIDDALYELNARAERGEGIWSAGYLYTKNAIKAQKRTRSWAKPLSPTDPGLTNSHTRAADSKPLITQMDPDAQTREGHVLQPQDDFHEQYAWQACWELLRRGETQDSVGKWWTERKEIWRAVSLRSAFPQSKDQEPTPFYRIMNLAKNEEWRKRCKQLCENGGNLYTYQSAVYGILCGDTKPVAEACKTVDDSLFSIFNALLIARYRYYVNAYHQKLENPSKSTYTPPQANWEQVRRFLAVCQNDDKTREESHEPLRAIQAAIISKDFDKFFVRVGQAAAQVAHMTSESAHLMERLDESIPSDECAQITAGDPDSVRMVVHLQLILRALGYLHEPYEQNLYIVENNIANYIGWLQREDKWAIIPLYASQLSESRVAHVLGAILIKITDAHERDFQVKLMKKYKIDVPAVLWGIFSLSNFGLIESLSKGGLEFKSAKITEYTGTGRVKHIKIRSRFIGDEINNDDELGVRSIEWFRYVDAENWGRACWAAAAMYITFLYEGRLAAASALAERASLCDISLAALNMNLNIAETSDDDDIEMDGLAQEEESKPISPSRRHKQPQHKLLTPGTNRDQLASKSLVWAQLEQLTVVMNAFERWNDMADEVEDNRNNPSRLRALKKELLAILDVIRETMYPILSDSFLCHPNDEAEAEILRKLRNHYLPECVLAYNSVLYFAGHALSRSWLVECMNLAQVVATTSSLTEACIEGKRMQELVTAFALDSQALLHANEAGGKKGKKDVGIDVWNIKGFEQREPVDLEALD